MGATTTTPSASPVGALVRRWRHVRRLSQLDLALQADVSQRHLSCVETGRSHPSRQLLLHLARVLEVPLRDRNALLRAGGFAAVYPEARWDDPQMAPAREAVAFLLLRHEPYPAMVLDRRWELVDANPAAVALIGAVGGPDAMAAAEGNAMRLLVHPDGLRRTIANWDEVGGHLADRIRREAAVHPDDDELQSLAGELLATIGPVATRPPDTPVPMVVASHLRAGDVDVVLMSMLASVGGALDATLSELVVELFYPADDASAAVLEELGATPVTP